MECWPTEKRPHMRSPCTRRTVLQLTAATLALTPFAGLAQSAPMKIGIVGAGNIGGTIGELWAKAGHKVFFSSRHPDELEPLVARSGPNAQAGTVADAIAFGDVIFIAVPYSALPGIGRDNAAALKGKVVLNASNPIVGRDGEVARAAQRIGVDRADRQHLPGTRIVRTFTSPGSGTMASQAHRSGEKLGIATAGNDPAAMNVAVQLVRDAGFEPVTVPLARARDFAPGTPLFGRTMSASEMRKALGVTR
jgi:predicted dinucleotide-binding enzyme